MASESEYIEQLRTLQQRPLMPGEVVAGIAEDLGLTQSELAERLGVGRQTINELLRGKRTLTPDMAHRLGRFFGNGPALWLNLQRQVDLWDALHMDTGAYAFIEPIERAA